MSVSVQGSGSEEMQIVAGEKLKLKVRAYDPAGIRRIFVQCFQFSMQNTNRTKLASGETVIPPEEGFSGSIFEVIIQIPDNAALGKWGVKAVEFTNGRGYKTSFYRGQGKFDNIIFDVVSPPTQEDEMLKFDGIEINGNNRCA